MSTRFRGGAQSGSHRPVSTPCPPNRTCGSPASGSPVGSCISHTERQFGAASSHRRSLAVPVALRAPGSQKLHGFTRGAPLQRAVRPVHALTAPSLPSVSPAPSLTHVMFRNSLPFHAGFLGKATPAGLRPSVIPPHLRPLSSTGITPRLQSYGPLRHPAGPACPSRGSGCRVHGTGRTSRVATPSIFHACRRHYPGGNRPVLSSLSSQPVGGLPLISEGSASATPVSRPAQRSLSFRPAWSLGHPRRPFSPEGFNPCRYLHEPLWPLPAGTTVAGWGSHPPGKRAFPRRTEKSGLDDVLAAQHRRLVKSVLAAIERRANEGEMAAVKWLESRPSTGSPSRGSPDLSQHSFRDAATNRRGRDGWRCRGCRVATAKGVAGHVFREGMKTSAASSRVKPVPILAISIPGGCTPPPPPIKCAAAPGQSAPCVVCFDLVPDHMRERGFAPRRRVAVLATAYQSNQGSARSHSSTSPIPRGSRFTSPPMILHTRSSHGHKRLRPRCRSHSEDALFRRGGKAHRPG